MKPWLQRQLKEPIVFLQVPFPQASLSHSFISRTKKGQRGRHGDQRGKVMGSLMLKSSRGCIGSVSGGWNVLPDGVSLERLRWEPTSWKFLHGVREEVRRGHKDWTRLLFYLLLKLSTLATLLKCFHLKMENLRCISGPFFATLWNTSAFRIHASGFPKVVSCQAVLCNPQQNSPPQLSCHLGHGSFLPPVITQLSFWTQLKDKMALNLAWLRSSGIVCLFIYWYRTFLFGALWCLFWQLTYFCILPKQLASFLHTILSGSRKKNTGTIGSKMEAIWAKDKARGWMERDTRGGRYVIVGVKTASFKFGTWR